MIQIMLYAKTRPVHLANSSILHYTDNSDHKHSKQPPKETQFQTKKR